MTLSNSLHVVYMGCCTLSALAADQATAERLVKAKVMATLYQLVEHAEDDIVEAALQVRLYPLPLFDCTAVPLYRLVEHAEDDIVEAALQ
eukprot:4076514-Pyramimonas_sp.AAC.1